MVRRAEGEIGESVVLIARVNHKMSTGDDAGSQGALDALRTYAIGYSKYVTMYIRSSELAS